MLEDAHYAIALGDICESYRAFLPPTATSVSAGAAKSLIIKQPGTAGGLWSADETPYMVEPMDTLSSRLHEAVAFVGPARTGKTAGLLLGWLTYGVVNDPGDMLMIQMTQDKAREFSKTDVKRAIDNSPDVSNMLSHLASDRNTHDTMFKNGMWLRIAWPTVSNVSGSTYRYTATTDYDRIGNVENVDGEGPLFDLQRKRTTTFLSRGMSLVESSPGIELTDPAWKPATPHEAPPVTGVLGIYNRSDRKRWYWPCLHCDEHFEAAPGLGLFNLPKDEVLMDGIRTMDIEATAKKYGARIIAPCCGAEIPAQEKTRLNARGVWLSEGQRMVEGVIVGEPSKSKIVGFWLGGVAAAYQPWESLVLRHLQGLKDYALTGSEETLKATTNTDQGMPYMARHLVESQNATSRPQDRAEDGMQRYAVPPETRMLMGSVDVQGGVRSRFIYQLHAVGPNMEQWLVDRDELIWSKRPGMGTEFAPIDPAKYPEDWDVITDKLLLSTWRTPTAGREIKIKRLVVDSGGEAGVTQQAYEWFRRVVAMGMGDRVRLYKGASEKKAPMIKETKVGRAKGKGDIPLLLCNTNLMSDAVDAGLRRATGGAGYVHLPVPQHPTLNPNGWLKQAFFDELEAEVRGKDGVWRQVRKRNETFDLLRMMRANMLSLRLPEIKDWNQVPPWLAPLDKNSEIVSTEDRRAMKESPTVAIDQPVRVLAPVRRPRRHAYAAI